MVSLTKNIKTLIPDIYHVVENKDGRFTRDIAEGISASICGSLGRQLGEQPERDRGTLRMSRLGSRCPRALWFELHHPELREAVPPWAEIKFSYGHVLEGLAIGLAKAAGHTVTGEQDELHLDGITGHRDCVIDGCVVDVKSSASRSFIKFRDGSIRNSDSFGYLDQLDAYILASSEDPLVSVKDRGYLLAIDKTLGHMVLYEHILREEHIKRRIVDYKRISGLSSPPACTCGTRPEGKSGNIGLDTVASYSAYKYCCFPDLRTFIYASGPVYLTHVARLPDVPEVDRYGNFVGTLPDRFRQSAEAEVWE